MAQTQAIGHHQNRLNIPRWAREMCGRAHEAEVRMVSGERAFQAARLFYLENCHIIDRLDGGLESFCDQWTEVGDLRRTVRTTSSGVAVRGLGCLVEQLSVGSADGNRARPIGERGALIEGKGPW